MRMASLMSRGWEGARALLELHHTKQEQPTEYTVYNVEVLRAPVLFGPDSAKISSLTRHITTLSMNLHLYVQPSCPRPYTTVRHAIPMQFICLQPLTKSQKCLQFFSGCPHGSASGQQS